VGKCTTFADSSTDGNSCADKKLSEIRKWLSAPDPSTNYQKALKLRQADTGGWFLKGEEYTTWIKEAAWPSPLWLYGIPGCGKTILCSAVLQDVLQYCQDGPGRVAAFFFFDFNDVQKQDPEKMVRSLLCQLLQQFVEQQSAKQQSVNVPASLDDLFCSCKSGQRQSSSDALLEVLRLMVKELPQVYVVVDALDECAQRAELMETLNTIAGWELPNLHLLVTSRREQDIEFTLTGFVSEQNRICLQSTLVDRDIQRYVRQRLSDDKRLQKWGTDATVLGDIEATVMGGAKGMYVYLLRACRILY
jgi:hypothetical protein